MMGAAGIPGGYASAKEKNGQTRRGRGEIEGPLRVPPPPPNGIANAMPRAPPRPSPGAYDGLILRLKTR